MPLYKCKDPVALNLWYAIAPLEEVRAGKVEKSALLDQPIAFSRDAGGQIAIWTHGGDGARQPGTELPVQERYGYA